MTRKRFVLPLVCLCSIAGCGDEDGVASDCGKLCDTVVPVGCGDLTAADCPKLCEQGVSSRPNCKSETKDLINCQADTSASDWECVDGETWPKTGVCESETHAMVVCIGE